ncbi:ethanolamine ammonia-lyase reactivating factor EutA [Capnocytophaga sp. ARDL2]|uniref:Ppx/GppA phosphatase family protein n=1 Tax=Capnocytophaga sp. ARDL2 TaxID=3238809 RepID=UPI003556D50E
MEIKKYGVIDIGSNAIRLLISNVVERNNEVNFNKSELVRVPIRLGQDVFTTGKISEYNIKRMVKAMESFKLLMQVYEVCKYTVCATSAMREANNANEIVEIINQETGVFIDIISGEKEAKIIAASDLKQFIQKDSNYLYIDVGGGSTELTVFSHGKIVISKSFPIGTVRLINQMVAEETWNEIQRWTIKYTSNMPNIQVIGSGGNINKISKMATKSNKNFLSFPYLKNIYNELVTMAYEERVSTLGLNPDRADVIVPAMNIYIKVMKWSRAKNIIVPKIGLSDGIVKMMYYNPKLLKINKL